MTESKGLKERHGYASMIYGFSPTYVAWKNMLQRCNNLNNKHYKDYGGRGIKVCDERWFYFSAFLADMGEKPVGLTLERRDNNKGYSKDNCKWATTTEQNLNQRFRKDNPWGIKGVYSRGKRWYANARKDDKLIYLYSGTDFFAACCARKSWDAKRGR